MVTQFNKRHFAIQVQNLQCQIFQKSFSDTGFWSRLRHRETEFHVHRPPRNSDIGDPRFSGRQARDFSLRSLGIERRLSDTVKPIVRI
jgi:hypothetical protein